MQSFRLQLVNHRHLCVLIALVTLSNCSWFCVYSPPLIKPNYIILVSEVLHFGENLTVKGTREQCPTVHIFVCLSMLSTFIYRRQLLLSKPEFDNIFFFIVVSASYCNTISWLSNYIPLYPFPTNTVTQDEPASVVNKKESLLIITSCLVSPISTRAEHGRTLALNLVTDV